MKEKMMKRKSVNGFTLIEMLVVVLIIGILAGIALPQYQMAVTKAKVASILPLMRRWKDALQEYKLQHGSYVDYDNETEPNGATLGVNWPSDWTNGNFSNKSCGDALYCISDYWNECYANEEGTGHVHCFHQTSDGGFIIYMYQHDDPDCEVCRDKIMCFADGEEGNKVCKALGGKPVETDYSFDYTYSL